MLTVCCVWVDANVPYSAEYVARLRAMTARHLARPHRFVCLTDRPAEVPAGVEAVEIDWPQHLYGWWAKLQVFNPRHDLGERVLYLDLDTLVVASLDEIADYPADFAIIPHDPRVTFMPKGKLQIVRRFNSSVMVWSRGAAEDLFEEWRPDYAKQFWGDQDYIGWQRPVSATMPLCWFPRVSDLRGQPPGEAAKVVLVKKPKNDVAARLWPWFAEAWRVA